LALLLGVAAAAIVLVIAFVTIARVVGATATVPRQSVFDLNEAEAFVADRLDDEAQAQVSYEDVRIVLGCYLDYLTERGVAFERDDDREDPATGAPLVLGEDRALAFVLGQVSGQDVGVPDHLVAEIFEATESYLRAIGAVGVEVPEPEEPGN
jgi:hypothetical protein